MSYKSKKRKKKNKMKIESEIKKQIDITYKKNRMPLNIYW